MRTVLSPDNPIGYNRAGYAWEKVPAGGEAHLDFGCHQGSFLNRLAVKGPRRLVGVDVASEPVEAGKARYPSLELIRLEDPHRLPFPDATFDSASALDVIEHVADQKRVLDELHRALKPEGILILTVPGQYLFSCLDLGNLKFRLPAVHRWWYRLRHSRAEYESRYAANPDGLVGDVSAAKGWHEHFTRAHLTRLLGDSGFIVTEFDGSGCFSRPIELLATPVLGERRATRWLRSVYRLDARWFSSMNLFCTARKRG